MKVIIIFPHAAAAAAAAAGCYLKQLVESSFMPLSLWCGPSVSAVLVLFVFVFIVMIV